MRLYETRREAHYLMLNDYHRAVDGFYTACVELSRVAGYQAMHVNAFRFCDYVFGLNQGDSTLVHTSRMDRKLAVQMLEFVELYVFTNFSEWVEIARECVSIMLELSPEKVKYDSTWSLYSIKRPALVFGADYRITGRQTSVYAMRHRDFTELALSLFRHNKEKSCESVSKSFKTSAPESGHSSPSRQSNGYYVIHRTATENAPYGIATTANGSGESSRTNWVAVANLSTSNFDPNWLDTNVEYL